MQGAVAATMDDGGAEFKATAVINALLVRHTLLVRQTLGALAAPTIYNSRKADTSHTM